MVEFVNSRAGWQDLIADFLWELPFAIPLGL